MKPNSPPEKKKLSMKTRLILIQVVFVIVNSLSKMLYPEKVMIGVPESIRIISFEASIDDRPTKTISIVEPISITDYILTSKA